MHKQTFQLKKCVLIAVSVFFVVIGSLPTHSLVFASPGSQSDIVILSIEPTEIRVARDETFSINLVVGTGTQDVEGVNAFVDFDNSALEVQDSDTEASGVQIQGNDSFPDQLENEASNATGEIDYRSRRSTSDEGVFVLATINFRALDITSADGTILTFSTLFPRTTFPHDSGGSPLPSSRLSSTVHVVETDLSITKNANPNPQVIAGEPITYSIFVTNNGPSDALNITVSDTIPGGATFVSATPGAGSGPYDELTGIWDAGSLANGASVSLMLTVLVDSSAIGSVSNTAVVDDQFDPFPDNNSDTVETSITQLSDLHVNKIGSPSTVLAGNQIEYTITVANDGPSDATDVLVVESVPDEITIESAAFDRGNFDAQLAEWALSNLEAGQSEVLVITATVNSGTPVGTVISNIASVQSSTLDPNSANNSAEAQVVVSTSADLSVEKSTNFDSANAGELVSYAVSVTNNGPSDALDVHLNESNPDVLSFVSAVPSTGSFDEDTGIWDVGSMSDGQTETMALVFMIAPDAPFGNSIENIVIVDASTPDPNGTNDTDSVSTQVFASADLRIGKVADIDTAIADRDEITYTITINNDGPSDAPDVEVLESLPDEVTIQSSTVDAGSFNQENGIWSIETLAVGQSEELEIVVSIDAEVAEDTVLENSAAITSSVPDPDGNDNAVTNQVQVVTTADIRLEIAANPNPVIAGNLLAYDVTVTNAGPSGALDIVTTVLLPPEVEIDSFTNETGDFDAQAGVWDIEELSDGESANLQLVTFVKADTPEGAIIESEGSAATSTPDSEETNNSAISGVEVIARADLALDKESDLDAVVAGQDEITYTTAIVNNGPSYSQDVRVTDVIPNGLNIESITKSRGDFNESTGEWTVGLLPTDQSATLTMIATVAPGTPDGTNLINQAIAESSTVDPDTSNNSDTVGVLVERETDLSIIKSANPASVVAGEQLAYTITVTNNGPDSASNIVVSDDLPDGTHFDADASSGNCSAVDDIVSCTSESLASDDNVAFTVVVDVAPSLPEGSTISNTAQVDSDQVDRNDSNDSSAPVVTQITALSDLSVNQAAIPSQGVIGSQLSFVIDVTNSGPSNAHRVQVTDTLPEQVVFVSADSPEFDESTGIWNVSDLPAGQTSSLTIVVNVPPDMSLNTMLVNLVDVAGDQLDPDVVNNSNVLHVPVTVATDLSVTIEDSADPVIAGSELYYTVEVGNSGPSVATGVVATSVLPDGVNLISTEVSKGSFDNQNGVWSVGDLGVGEFQVLRMFVEMDPTTSGTVLSVVEVHAEQPDHDGANNLARHGTQVVALLDSASAQVEPATGAIVDTGSEDAVEASVTIPPEALEATAEIRVATVSVNDASLPLIPDTDAALGRAANFSPSGLEFDIPITITFIYSDDEVIGIDENTLIPLLLTNGSWVSINENCPAEIAAPLDPCLFERVPDENRLVIKSSHFSTFAVQASNIKVVTVTSEKEARPGDSYFAVVSTPGDSPETAEGTPLVQIEALSELLVKMHGLGKAGLDASTHVLFGTVPDDQPVGLLQLDINVGDGTTLSVDLNIVSERTNRNFYLGPELNFMGLGLVPENPNLDNVLSQPVANANDEFASLMGRTVTLADIVSRIFAYDEIEDAQGNHTGTFLMNNTPHPCGAPTAHCFDPNGGLTPADSLTELEAYRGMILETRSEVNIGVGDEAAVTVFDEVYVPRLQSEIAVPVRVNVRGRFLDLDLDEDGVPSIPIWITKELNPGFNLIAPHIDSAANFERVFSGALEPIAVAERAFTSRRAIKALTIGSEIDIDFIEETVAISHGELVEPEFSYWVYIKDFLTQDGEEIEVRPIITPLGQ